MATTRETFKVPLGENPYSNKWLEKDREFYYRLDVYRDDTVPWDEKTVVVHFPGAGVNAPYPKDSWAAPYYLEKGFIFCVAYYFQRTFKDEEDNIATTPLPWKEDWSDYRSYSHHLMGRAFMIQSIASYVLSKYPTCANNLYLSGKSRGGSALMAWSYLSKGYSENISNKIKAIHIFQGYTGSAEDEKWIEWGKTIRTLCSYMTNINHKAFFIYNDNDRGSQLTPRLINSVPNNSLSSTYFMNFATKGHTMDWELSAELIRQIQQGNTNYEFKGKDIKSLWEITQNEREANT